MFGFDPQVSTRTAPTVIDAGYFQELFWDGRASTTFRDPTTGTVAIANGGALESQLVEPILNHAEMAHDVRTWSEVLAKLGRSSLWRSRRTCRPTCRRPSPAIRTTPSCSGGRSAMRAITAERVAFAIATYERTLVADQSPWDQFSRGQANALTPQQQAGRQLFFGVARCSQCHTPGLFSDRSYRNIGIRPPFEDAGRQGVTGNPQDAGRFKVPSLRNVALRSRFMHPGQFDSLQQVVNFYNAPPPPMPGRDPLIAPIGLNPTQRSDLVAFLGALTDPRVASQTGPFSRPTLYSQRVPPAGELYGAAGVGSGGVAPRMLAEVPLRIGIPDFRIGVHDGLGGAFGAFGLALGASAPGSLVLGAPLNVDPATTYLVPLFLQGSGPGGGYATFNAPLPNDPGLSGLVLFGQWFVADPNAPQQLATSAGARWSFF